MGLDRKLAAVIGLVVTVAAGSGSTPASAGAPDARAQRASSGSGSSAARSRSHATHRRAIAPYRSVEVRVPTRDHQVLAGTLTLPSGTRLPALLLLSSADATDRDASNSRGLYHPFRQIADTLSRHGIAVLRLDDRGAGKSTGRLDTLTTAERANDARDALAFLRARSDIDRARIGILGHSEGGSIATMVAAEDTMVRALILMAAAGEDGRHIVEAQQRYEIMKSSVARSLHRRMLMIAMQDWNKRVAKDRWAAFFDTYDPLPAARKVHVPVLILHGTEDVSCPPGNADALAAALRSGGSTVELQHLVGVDHAFLKVRDFSQGVAYGDGAFLLSGDVLSRIVDWAVAHLR